MADAQEPQPQTAPSDGIWVPALKEAGVAFVAAALLLIIFYVFAFRWIHPEFVPFMDQEAAKVIAPGKDLIPVSVGAYRVEGSTAIIEDFNGDEAILALPRAFQAEDYPFIKVNLQGFTRYSKFKILWRRVDDLSQTHALEFNRSGNEATQIAMVYSNENYRGQIADIALLFYDGPALGFESNHEVGISIHSVEFRPFSAWWVAEQIFEDWINPPLWRGSAHNVVMGIHDKGMLAPNSVANYAAVTGLFITLVLRAVRHRRKNTPNKTLIFPVALCLCFYGWGVNEIFRWHWRIDQFIDTHERYAGKSLDQRVKNSALRCARYSDDCKKRLLPYF